MKNFVKLSAIKLKEKEMKQIIGGEGNQNKGQQQGPPPLLRYAIIIPMYGVPAPKE